MKRLPVFSLLLFLALWAASGTAAHAQKPGPPPHPWEMDDSVLARLELSAAQQVKIETLREAFQQDIAPLRSQLFEKKAELKWLWMQATLDPDRIKSLEGEHHRLIGKLREKGIDYRLAFHDLLTPEQWSRFISLADARKRHSFGTR